ncbi:hypothetical protein [Bernardetia sp.]|uniref:hypothetical protein n=1 Tax=Bernardetia sp. TaxID=1937974 RepID=UPI0025C2D772|nr:hypothetical protein [Bernardetia sp.]
MQNENDRSLTKRALLIKSIPTLSERIMKANKNLRQRIIHKYEQVISETNNPKRRAIYQKWVVCLKEKEVLSQAKP